MKKFLMVPLETKVRELDARLFLSLKVISRARNNEWEVILGERTKVGKHWQKGEDRPYVFLANGIENQESYYQQIFATGGRFVLLDEEGGVFSKFVLANFPRGGYDHDCLKCVARVFLWGETEKENWFKRHKDMTIEQGVVTGNPRFDISKNQFSNYFRSISSYSESNKKYVLINCAFGSGNNIVNVVKEASYWSDQKGNERLKEKYEPDQQYQKKLLPLFIEGIQKLVEVYSDQLFIIRPHPIENKKFYENAFKTNPNVSIIQTGAVQEWFPNAQVMIHSGCTTGIEAFYAGIEPIVYAPYIELDYIQTLTFDVSTVANTADELIQHVGRKLNGPLGFSKEKRMEVENVIKPHISNVDYMSADRIADELEGLSLNENDFDFRFNGSGDHVERSLNKIRTKSRNVLSKLSREVRLLITKKHSILKEMKKRDEIKFNSLTIDEVDSRIDHLCMADSSICDIKAEQIGENLFRLSRG